MYIKEINIKNQVCNYCFGNLIKAKKKETKTILIKERNYKDLVIYFTSYVHCNSIKILSFHYHELIRKIEDYEGKYF